MSSFFVELFSLGKNGRTRNSIGKVHFVTNSAGQLFYVPQLRLPRTTHIQPYHGFHIHSVPGDLNNAGTGAGPHFDPGNTHVHRGPTRQGHLGDLPPVAFNLVTRKSIERPVLIPRLNAAQLKRLIGYPVILHERGDNFSDTPTRDGGGLARLFGGFIEYAGD
jgi:Cu-Zn family superoxide dismutase